MNTVLVTGATGALGQAVIARLRKDGCSNVLPTSRHCSDVSGFRLDVLDHNQAEKAIHDTKPDLVLHLAATYSSDFEEAYALNVGAARHLLEVVQHSGLQTRILLVGSAAEYGVVRPEENPIDEDHVLRPVSVYGITKAWQTQLAGLYASRGVDVVVARVSNLDGPGLSERLFIGRLQNQIAEVKAGRKSVIELGPLSATRDYVSTVEAADQLLAIAAHANSGEVYHVASGVPITMRALLGRYLTMNGLDESIVQEAVELSNRIGYDVPVIYANITKTTHLLNHWRKRV